MTPKQGLVWIPVEVQKREFHGKLLLALELSCLGVTSFFGQKAQIHQLALQSNRQGVYLTQKGFIRGLSPDFKFARKARVKLVGMDEESGISFLNFEEFAKTRPELQDLIPFEAFFLWGMHDYSWYKRHHLESHLLVSGSPRAAFWGSFGKLFFEPEIKQLDSKFGDFILVITNFTEVNRKVALNNVKSALYSEGYRKADFHSYYRDRFEWELQARDTLEKVLHSILQKSKQNIVLRTHPAEDKKYWEKLFEHYENFHVIDDGAGSPWVQAARTIIHAGSTLALEAVSSDASLISYENLFGRIGPDMTATKFSKTPASIDEVLNLIQEDETQISIRNRIEGLNWYAANAGTTQAAKTMSKAIQSVLIEDERRGNVGSPFKGFVETGRASALKAYGRLRYGSVDYGSLGIYKQNDYTYESVMHNLLRLSEICNLRVTPKLTQIGHNIFQIEPVG